jgi:ribonuclease HII
MKCPTLKHEKALYKKGYTCIAGIDEVGKGAWAGPIVAACVIFPQKLAKNTLKSKDSKMLTKIQRERIYKKILEKAQTWSIGLVQSFEIDKLGIHEANKIAIKRAVEDLKIKPNYLILDNIWGFETDLCDFEMIKKGDQRVFSIASASIIAKVQRDNLMTELSKKYPEYGFEEHKGYGTRKHYEELLEVGPCEIHRVSYRPIKGMI